MIKDIKGLHYVTSMASDARQTIASSLTRKSLGLSIQAIQVFIRTPTGSVLRGNQQFVSSEELKP
jgi:hypothetical protein